jgi:hypothetical protein
MGKNILPLFVLHTRRFEMFAKFARILVLGVFLAGLIAIPAAAATTYSISGSVTLNGVGLKGVSVKVSGTLFKAVTTATGAYTILAVPAGTAGSLVATYTNYSFLPLSIPFTALAANLTGKNFTATLTNHSLYSMTGVVTLNAVGLAGVTVSFLTYSAVTNASGVYTILNVPAASTGRIVPKLAGYGFTPVSDSVTNLSANLSGKNFTATQALTIAGKVTDKASLLAVSGVKVTCGTLSATTGATGTYTIRNVPVGTSCSLTPSLAGKTFTPANIAITNLQAVAHAQNFVAVP